MKNLSLVLASISLPSRYGWLKCISIVSLIVFPSTWGNWSILAAESTEQVRDDEAVILKTKQFLEWIETRKNEMDASRYEVDALSEKLGNDADGIVGWTASHLRWVPYEGRLKGFQSVLLSGRANSLDASLFLSHLLGKSGFETRLMEASLDAETYQIATQELLEMGTRNEDAADVEPPTVTRIEFEKEVDARISFQMKRLKELGLSMKPEGTSDMLKEKTLYWVEYQKQGGGWESVSPFWGADIPVTLTDDKRAKISSLSDGIPDNLKHKFGVEVVVVRKEGDRFIEQTVLERTFATETYGNREISIGFSGMHALTEDEIFEIGQSDPGSIEELIEANLLNEDQWVPMIKIGNEETFLTDLGFGSDGKTFKPEDIGVRDKLSMASGFFTSLGSTSFSNQNRSMLTSVWINFTVQVPGQPTKAETRVLFDVNEHQSPDGNLSQEGQVVRAASLSRYTSVLSQTGQIPESYVEWKQISNLGTLKLGLQYLLKRFERDPAADLSDSIRKVVSKIDSMESALWALAALRQKHNLYLPEVNLISFVGAVLPGSQSDTLSRYSAVDIINNKVASISSNGETRFTDCLLSGIRDSNIETYAFSDIQGISSAPATSDALMEAEGDWQWISADDTTIDQNVKTDLEMGYSVLLCGNESENVWWRVDRNTGEILGMANTSFGKGGQTLTEYQIKYMTHAAQVISVMGNIVGLAKCKSLGCAICSGIGLAVSVFGMLGSPLLQAATGLGGATIGFGCGLFS